MHTRAPADPTHHARTRPIEALDQANWEQKLRHLLLAAQPFDARGPNNRSPAFPTKLVPNTMVAARRIVHAAEHMYSLWGIWPEARDNRSPRAIQAWRDLWTHPEVYRRLFSEWVGLTYLQRKGRVERLMQQTAIASRLGPPDIRPPPSWDPTVFGRSNQRQQQQQQQERSLGASDRNNDQDTNGGQNTGLYAHGEPERFGHHTHLIDALTSEAAQYYFRQVRTVLNASDSDSDVGMPDIATQPGVVGDPPGLVVRLLDPGWYLGGFLASVLVWTHLALVEPARIRNHGMRDRLDNAGIDVHELVQRPETILDGPLLAAWKRLQYLLEQCRCEMRRPIPDLIRVPQEWCIAMQGRGEGRLQQSQDRVQWSGISGPERRLFLQTPMRDLGIPDWLYRIEQSGSLAMRTILTQLYGTATKQRQRQQQSSSPDVRLYRYWKTLTQYLRMLQDEHMAMVVHAQMNRHIRATGFDIPERYLPIPDLPNPMTGLYIPWSGLYRQPFSIGSEPRWREIVHSLTSVADVLLQNLSICCMETGLSLEQWGQVWTQAQRQESERLAQQPMSQKRLRLLREIMTGQSVTGWEDAPRKRFLAAGIMVIDEKGPVGDGYRIYDEDDRISESSLHREQSLFVLDRSDRWFRLEALTAVERLRIEGPLPDEYGRWEDSGIEMPTAMIRHLRRDLLILDQKHHEGGITGDSESLILGRALRSLSVVPVWPPPDPTTLQRLLQETFQKQQQPTAPPASSVSGIVQNLAADRSVRLELWRQAAGRTGRRTWRLRVLDPWPVSTNLHGVDLTRLDGRSLTLAPVIRELQFERALVPSPTWLRDLVTMPSGRIAKSGPGVQDMIAALSQSPEAWVEAVAAAGLWASLFPTARRTLVRLGFDSVRFNVGVDRSSQTVATTAAGQILASALLPGTPLPLRSGPTEQIISVPSPFRFYPNLSLVSLRGLGLGDIPRGLLDYALSSQSQQSPSSLSPAWGVVTRGGGGGEAAPAPRKGFPNRRTILWDLSGNQITQLSADTLESLSWLVIRLAAVSDQLLRPFDQSFDTGGARGQTMDDIAAMRARLIAMKVHYDINLWGNPVLRQPGFKHKVKQTRDPATGEVVRVQVELNAEEYLLPRLAALLGPGRPRDLRRRLGNIPVPSLEYIAKMIGSMLLTVHPILFEQEMQQKRLTAENQRYQWSI